MASDPAVSAAGGAPASSRSAWSSWAAPAAIGAAVGAAAAAAGVGALVARRRRLAAAARAPPPIGSSALDLIGNTPMVRLRSLSEATGCEVLAKIEMGNPGGSVKDRVARGVVLAALRDGRLAPGGAVVEGTSGSTGASLAVVAGALGLGAVVALPDDTSREKIETLRALGAVVALTRPSGIAHPGHYVNVARRIAQWINDRAAWRRAREGGGGGSGEGGTGAEGRGEEGGAGRDKGFTVFRGGAVGSAAPAGVSSASLSGSTPSVAASDALGAPAARSSFETGIYVDPHLAAPLDLSRFSSALFADQFETAHNARAHVETGLEILQQTGGRLDAFVAGAGTGGTLAGVSAALRARAPRARVVAADPPGSGVLNAVRRGVMFDAREAEGTRERHAVDTLVEGIGLNRWTRNFSAAKVDAAVRVTDAEAAEMAAYLVRNEGIWVGSSSAVAAAAAAKVARRLGRERRVGAGREGTEAGSNGALLDGRGLASSAPSRDGRTSDADAAPRDGRTSDADAAPRHGRISDANAAPRDGRISDANAAPRDGRSPAANAAPRDGRSLAANGASRNRHVFATSAAPLPRVVVLFCDGGYRHLSKFYSPEVLEKAGIRIQGTGRGIEFLGDDDDTC